MKKAKIVSGLMALAMTVAATGISASAADSVQVTIGKDKVSAGEKFSVTVDLGSVPSSGLNSIDFAIDYDETLLTISDVSLGTVGDTGAKSQEGDYGDTVFNWKDNGSQVIIVWSTGLEDSSYWIKKSGTFVTITGTAKSNAAKGSVAKLEGVSVDRAEYPGGGANKDTLFSAVAVDGSQTDYAASFTAGSVTIGDEETTTPPSNAVWGDVDCNGDVDVRDSVLLARLVGSDDTLKDDDVTDQGKNNADVTHDGRADSNDLSKLMRYMAGYIKIGDLATK
ncbi:MAG: Cohesin domain protein [Oscillospiraceae bacterium]|nr:Cohesin domain protein [Oscillospiraceae bacterium]